MSGEDHASIILALDKWQGSERGKSCPKDKEHGKLTAHGSGQHLLCTICGYHEQVSRELVTQALEAGKWVPKVREGGPLLAVFVK